MFKYIIVFLTIGSSFFCTSAFGQESPADWKEEANIYNKVFDASITTSNDVSFSLSQLYVKKPLLLALIFTRCSGICNPFLVQLKENLQSKMSNENFEVLVVSFDPRDTKEDMSLLSKNLGIENNEQWLFATTEEIEKLIQSVGFNPVWDSTQNQFDHDAMLVGINKEGYITKKLIGIRDRQALGLLISSVNDVFSPSYRLPGSSQLFSCFNYNPKTGKNTPGWGLLFLALPAFIALSLVLGINYAARNR